MKKTTIHEKKLLDAPSTFLNPVPVIMVSCCGKSQGYDKPNIITIAWAGTVNSEPPMISISVRKTRHSHRQIIESQEFVVNLVSESLIEACDYCGVKSGREVDKFAVCHLSEGENDILEMTPSILNSPVSLYCKVNQIVELGSHDMFLAEIIAVDVDKELFESSGKVNLNKANLVVYSHGEYVSLKEVEGFFGFSLANVAIKNKRLPHKVKKGIGNTNEKGKKREVKKIVKHKNNAK